MDAPIVPVVKSDGSVRICGEYCLTVNQASRLDLYPLPRVEELFATLAGGKNLFKAGSQPCIFAATTGDELQTVYNNQYPSRLVPVQQTTLWRVLCTRDISESN